MGAATHGGAATDPDHDERTPATRDPLDMLVTSEPVAELDDALRCMGHQLRAARHRHDDDATNRLQRWIDGRLDERNTFRDGPSPHRVGPSSEDR